MQHRIKGIDGYKGVFSTTIVIYHYFMGGGVIQGYLGVDFFFIVSGFLWMMSMERSRYAGAGDYLKRNLCRYWPITTCVYITYVLFHIAVSGWGITRLKEVGLQIFYEIFYIHLTGVSSKSYMISYMWYIPVMIFILTVFTGLYVWKKDFFLAIFLPIAVIGCCTHIFASFGRLTDFRAVAQGEFFIKGVYRGIMDMGVGIAGYHFAPAIHMMLKRIRVIWVLALEIVTTGICYYIITCETANAADILIIPCSCVFIFLCCGERGILYRIMECRLFKWIGGMSLYIYLTQAFSITITLRVCGGDRAVFSLTTAAVLLFITIGIAAFARYLIIPSEIWIAKRVFIRRYPGEKQEKVAK